MKVKMDTVSIHKRRETKDGCFIMTENDTKGYFLIWKILMVLMISMMLKLKSHQHLQHHWPVSRHLFVLLLKCYIHEIQESVPGTVDNDDDINVSSVEDIEIEKNVEVASIDDVIDEEMEKLVDMD